MPQPDKTDYTREFYQQNVALSLKARAEMPWGKTIPEREFRHFVVPVRVNNENLDNSREVFYKALKPRVEKLSMKEAILEVNHWCHEHVTYRPSDGRTSSPLATLRTAYGRCGEQSTFTVAALRAVGIPARQVYTPRWAHTDDNHAWVEAWADGKWYFLGACEPEPVLNLGWFNESASRGMLMHTKAFGNYDGPEEVMSLTPCYTEINVVDNYAPTAQVNVQVVNAKGKPVSGARVEFKLYNYAEFYTVANKTTDKLGHASLTAGKGDMLLWVSKGGLVATRKVSFGKDKQVKIVLNSKELPDLVDLDIVPPPVSAQLPLVTPEQRAENNRRSAYEDSIRHAYEATMPVEDWRGNHRTIQQFLGEAPNKLMAQKLLGVLAKKDLRDIELAVLKDNQVAAVDTSDIYLKYVLCPRVELEWLTPYKTFFREHMGSIKNPAQLEAWCNQNIRIDNDHNPQGLRMQPMSVYREKLTDDLGRNIFFVSVARSLGMPARINEVNGKPQYYADGRWIDVFAKAQNAKQANTAKLKLDYKLSAHNDNPKYYIHFTLSKVVDGQLQLQTFPEEATQQDFVNGQELDKGEYILTTGVRMASGKVLARMQRFTLTGDTTISYALRENQEDVQVIGSLNAEDIYHDKATDSDKSLLSTTGRGYYVLAIVAPNQEPTNHAMRDISVYKQQFEEWGRKMIFLFQNDDEAQRFNFAEFDKLPNTVVWGTDVEGKIKQEVWQQMKLQSPALPVFLICDSFNRVVFVQQGYTINLGEQLIKVIRQL
ncbi:transglutaminase domain-containing protein [Xylanibacter ruminicola]|uniref:transglutaminase-like domain-containing protein n=1 Tax=Xylanibacter ruminicola TaxID=839 RepID=UPI00397DCEAE